VAGVAVAVAAEALAVEDGGLDSPRTATRREKLSRQLGVAEEDEVKGPDGICPAALRVQAVH